MYTVIFAGGQGTRISEETNKVPKPMIKIGPKPIVEHIMKIYTKNGFNKFIILTGYKRNKFKKYFDSKKNIFLDKKIKFSKKIINNFNESNSKNKIYLKLLYTGQKTNKKERLQKLKTFLSKEKNFFLTYGDGVSNVNIKKLLAFHLRHKKICTLTGVNPEQRYGLLKLNGNKIISFKEKKKIQQRYINAGFFVCKSKIFDFFNNKKIDFEENILPLLSKKGQLRCFKHHAFWQCMDTMRDKNFLKKLLKDNNAPWI